MSTANPDFGLPPVIKTITVPWPPAKAFERFTAEISSWWPCQTHSVAESAELEIVFEEFSGGRVYEKLGDHSSVWAEVLVWEPPHRFILNWHPGRAAETGGPVEVRFSEKDSGCQVELTHRGWENLGDDALELRTGYDSGWDFVLARYTPALSTGAG